MVIATKKDLILDFYYWSRRFEISCNSKRPIVEELYTYCLRDDVYKPRKGENPNLVIIP